MLHEGEGTRVVDSLVGRYEHSLDTKGRLVLPARLRPAFEAGGYTTKGPEGCAALWPHGTFHEKLAALQARAEEENTAEARARARVFSSADPVTPDLQGRVPIAQYLIDFAALDRARILVRGANTTVELWNIERWQDLEAALDKELLGIGAGAS